MKFDEALKMMKKGIPMKLPSWGGYWCWDDELETVIMYTKDNQRLDIRETQVVEYTLMNVLSDEWIPADGKNCPILGGEATFSFSEALKYLKRGLKVTRKNWNGKGQYIMLLDPYYNDQFTLQEKKPLGTFYPHLVIKTNYEAVIPWFPSATDVLKEDWMFAE